MKKERILLYEVGNQGFSCSYNSFNVGIKGHLFDIIDYYNFYYRTALRISSKTCSNFAIG